VPSSRVIELAWARGVADDVGHVQRGRVALAAANDQFRAARERTASLTYPEECLSRQELAELVNAYIWEHHRKVVPLDAGYVGKLERGIIRWPSILYREALRAVLGVSTDAALGFTNARRSVVKLENVDRKQFIHSTAALGAGTLALGPVAALLEGGEPTPIPVRVGATEIAQVRTARRVFESWAFTPDGGLAWETVLAQLRWSAGLLDASCPARLSPELHSAVGDLSKLAGFIAFDHCAHEEARRVFRFALGCAAQAGDWHLRATVLSGMANQAIWIGQPDEGLTLIDHALVCADRLSATERAVLHTGQARSLAKMLRVRETLIAVGTADDHYAHSTPANEPFMADYTGARHAELTGLALADLAISGRDHGEATNRLTEAVTGLTNDAYARAISQTKLACLTMATGDPAEAAALGTLRSRRVAEGLRELSRHAAAHQHINKVAHLRQRISTLGRIP
jgi:hypothetical protein